jgi:hypothetical protein
MAEDKTGIACGCRTRCGSGAGGSGEPADIGEAVAGLVDKPFGMYIQLFCSVFENLGSIMMECPSTTIFFHLPSDVCADVVERSAK